MVAYPTYDIVVHIQVLGQHPGDSKDLVTLQAAHHTMVQPASEDQANSETGACLHFQNFEGQVVVQAAAAKTSFPSTERMKDQAESSAAMAAAAKTNFQSVHSSVVVDVQLSHGRQRRWTASQSAPHLRSTPAAGVRSREGTELILHLFWL